MVRNPASEERITPIIPAIPKQILVSNITSPDAASEVSSNCVLDINNIYNVINTSFPSQSASSEIISHHQRAGRHVKSKVVKSKKKYCARAVNAGLEACFKIATAYVGDAAVYKLAGRHSAAFSVTPSKNLENNTFYVFSSNTMHKLVINGVN